jgi:hypothetical protein
MDWQPGRAAVRRPVHRTSSGETTQQMLQPSNLRMITRQKCFNRIEPNRLRKTTDHFPSLFTAKTIPVEDDSCRVVPDLTFAAHVNLNA